MGDVGVTAGQLILARAEAAGVVVEVDGDRLHLRAAAALPTDLVQELISAKAELLDLIAEREAIRSELTPPASGGAADDPFDVPQDEMLEGLRHAALRRPASWRGVDAIPTTGCWCVCCHGNHWWCRRVAPRCWLCSTCHPSPPNTATIEVQT